MFSGVGKDCMAALKATVSFQRESLPPLEQGVCFERTGDPFSPIRARIVYRKPILSVHVFPLDPRCRTTAKRNAAGSLLFPFRTLRATRRTKRRSIVGHDIPCP